MNRAASFDTLALIFLAVVTVPLSIYGAGRIVQDIEHLRRADVILAPAYATPMTYSNCVETNRWRQAKPDAPVIVVLACDDDV